MVAKTRAPAPPAAASSSSKMTPQAARLAALQQALSASTDLNPLAELLDLIPSLATPAPDAVLPKAVAVLVHALQALLSAGRIPIGAAVDAEGRLVAATKQGDAAKEVRHWMAQRWNDAVELLCKLLGHPDQATRILALEQLLSLQRAASSALSAVRAAAAGSAGSSVETKGEWSQSPFRSLMLALLAGPPALRGSSTERVELEADVRETFAENHLECFDDVRYCVCREVRAILHAPPPSAASAPLRRNGTQLLLLLTAIPKVQADLNEFFVPELAAKPAGLKLKGPKAAKKKAASKQKVVDGGGSEPEDDDESSDDMEDWFSDSDEESGKPKKEKAVSRASDDPQSRAAKDARRRGRRALPMHAAVHTLAPQRAAFSAAWLAVLLVKTVDGKHVGGDVPLALSHEVLVRFHAQILPNMVKPRLIVDWLVECLEAGGATSLLALNGLYTLMIEHNLLYPSFYTKLYSLLLAAPPFMHVRYRARFLRLLDTFLSSSHLSAALIASFAKRLSRAALRAPPAAAVTVVPFVWNLCKRHKSCMEMIHREMDGDRLSAGPAGIKDTYDPTEEDPHHTGALQSSLWELAALGASAAAAQNQGLEAHAGGEAHYLQGVSTMARILAEPFTKERWDLEDFLDVTYGTLFETETKRTLQPPRPKANGEARVLPAPAMAYALPQSAFPSLEKHALFAAAGQTAGQKHARAEGADEEDEEEKEAREAMDEVNKAQKRDTRDVCARLWAY